MTWLAEKFKRLRNAVACHKTFALILLLCLAWAGALQYEMRVDPPDLNDDVAHVSHALGVDQALPDLARATDPWLPSPGMGFPALHYYQHLPAFFLAAVYQLFLGHVPLILILRVTMVLLLAVFPLAVYASMRRFGMERLPAALAAVCSLLISDGYKQGWGFESYIWGGSGMYTQLWGMVLTPLAVSWGYVYLKEGRGRFGAVTFLLATCLSHILTGFVAVVSLFIILAAMDDEKGCWPGRLKRLATLFVLMGLAGIYYLVPFVRDGAYMNYSVWSHKEWLDSYGHRRILGWLFTGQLLDCGRYVPLTLFVLIGLVAAFRKWSNERYRIAAALFFVWLAIYCGRPTWGRLLDVIPFAHDMQFNRYVAGVHLAALMLAGVGAAAFYELVRRLMPRFKTVVASTLLVALLVPAFVERGIYLKHNSEWAARSRLAYRAEKGDLDKLLATLQALPPGRVFAGLPGAWGKGLRVGEVPLYAMIHVAGMDCLGFMYLHFALNVDIQYLFNENSLAHYRLFNVTYVVADRGHAVPAFLKPIDRIGRFVIYKVETGGYIDVVSSGAQFTGTKREWFAAARAWLDGPWFHAGDYPRIRLTRNGHPDGVSLPLSEAPAKLAEYAGEVLPPPGRVLEQSKEAYSAAAVVSMTRPGYVVFRSSYHPNWAVRVDGEKKDPVMLTPSYLGVAVSPGQHTVLFSYEPSRLRPWLFAMGCGILAALFLIERRKPGAQRKAG